MPKRQQRLRIGVIGCGIVAGYGHLPAIRDSNDWELAAVCDADAAQLQRVQKQYRAPLACRDYRQLLAVPGLDAVVIATHVDSHAAICRAAAERKLHVLCEKPLAQTAAEMRAMIAAMRRAKRLIAVNFNSRSAAQYLIAKQAAARGRFGRIKVVRIVYNWSAHQWRPPARLDQFMRHGGPIVDSAVHFFEFCRWLTEQEFAWIEAAGAPEPGYAAPSHGIAIAYTTGGVCCLIEAGWLYTRGAKENGAIYTLDVIGDRATLHYDMNEGAVRIYSARGTDRIPCPEDKDFPYVYGMLARSIRRGRLIGLASGEDAAAATTASLQALACAQRSMRLVGVCHPRR